MTTEAQRAVEDILEALSHDEDEGVVLYKIIVVLRKHGFVPKATTPSAKDSPEHDPGHPHLINGEFQSDKYPTTPRGKVPLSCKDPTAQDLLWQYAQRRRVVDAEFAVDLELALKKNGYDPGKASPLEVGLAGQLSAAQREREALRAELEQARVQLAGCGVAALGGTPEAKPGDYGYSASYGDVVRLYAAYDRLSGALAKAIETVDSGIEACTIAENRALYDFQRAGEQGKRDGLKIARDLLLELQVER